MKARVEIRQAACADLDGIEAVENACFAVDRFSRRQLAYLATKAAGVMYVAECGKAICGYISLTRRSRSRALRIYSLAVHPGARGRHIGQALIDKTREYAACNGLDKITLEVRPDNAAAVNLYKKNGFMSTAILKGYYADGTDALRMVLVLR